MTSDSSKPLSVPAWLLILLLAIWLLPGVIGREPWKSDESYTYGLVLHIIETGDHLAPTLAGEPFMQKPPLLFSTAALCVKALGSVMGFTDAARVSVLIFLGLTLVALALTGREVLGKGRGWLAPFMFMGTIGQFHISHMLITDVSLLTGFAVTLYGLVLWPRTPKMAGVVAGTGMGIAFMSKGLLGPGVMGIAILAMPVLFRAWRSRNYFQCLFIGGLASLPWVLIWPWLVYQRSPDLFHQWFWDNNLGRFLGASTLGLSNKIGMIDERYNAFLDFPWYAFPATIVAAWGFWKKRREGLATVGVQIALVSTLVLLTIVTASRNGRTLYMFPALAPVALLGAWGVSSLSVNFSKWTARVCLWAFGLVFAVAWVGWIAQITGQPAALWAFIHEKLPDLQPHFQLAAFIAALLFSAFWLVWMLRQRYQDGSQSLLYWTTGLAGLYLMVMTLWLPAMESRMSYTHLASIKDVLPADHGPVASLNVGEPQRGMFDYYAGLKTKRVELGMHEHDEQILVDGRPKRKHVVEYPDYHTLWFLTERELFMSFDPKPPGGPWEQVWQSVHSGKELFRLYRLVEPGSQSNGSQTANGISATR